jgi:gliding motility-associated-like protein
MRHRLLLCCIILCLVSAKAHADIFIVTSTADNGSGTLRQAIINANANGTSVPDTIRFNIPENIFNQRIIRLVTQLPALTSNLVIDGTTQPGQNFGNTDAKICIMKDDYAAAFTLFDITNASQVSIYGLYMNYGYHEGVFNPPPRSQQLFAINLYNSDDVEIGAPGKGNVINGYNFAIYSVSDSCRNIRIRSNYIGQGQYYPDITQDVDDVILSVISGIHIVNGQDILIGGPTPAEGNLIKADRAIGLNSYHDVEMGFIRIENNIIGKYYDRTRILGGQDMNCPNCPNVYIGPDPYLGPTGISRLKYDVSILNNDIPTSMGVHSLGKPFIIQGNKFELPPASTLFTSMSAKLTIMNCDAGLVGGPTIAQGNIFRQGGVTGINAIESYENLGVTISKNIYECNVLQATPVIVTSARTTIPFVNIDQSGATQVSGTATPNSTIELFYDDDCQACEGRIFIGATTSDALGNWTYSGSFTGTVLATATNSSGATGQFSIPETDISNVVITHPSCGQTNGSITGVVITGGNGYMWKDRNGNVVSNSQDLLNVGAGQYIFYAKLGNNCIRYGGFFELVENNTRIADTANKILINPSCGRNNGSIQNIALFPGGNSVIEWQNDRGQVIPGGEINAPYVSLRNLYPGRYRLFLRDTSGGGCHDSTFFYELVNTFGPVVDTNDVVITPATCGSSNGSITNIILRQLANTPFIQWVDSMNRPVGSMPDLMNQRPGRYRLKFREASGCDTVYTPYFTIPEEDLQIDSSQLLVTQSGCTQNNGSIRGLTAVGATGYRWINVLTGNQAGNTSDLLNAGAGSYRLEAFNNAGCTVQSNLYHIAAGSALTVSATNISERAAYCNQDNGFVRIENISNNPAYFSFHWLLDSMTTVGTGMEINGLAPGRYQCIATDTNGCQQQIYATSIGRLPMPSIDIRQLNIKPDTCQRTVGAITGVAVRDVGNGAQFIWTNAAGQNVGQQISLQNIPAGEYHLQVTDAMQCTIHSEPFTVDNFSVQLQAPAYNNVSIPRGSPVKLEPLKAGAGTYILYNAPSGGSSLQQNNTGIFDLPPQTADATYYIENQQGDCVSPRVAVEIRVVDESKVALPNAFTPNGDGLHDTWGIRVFGIVKLSYLRVFNRWGQVVFETNDVNRRWDGTLKGSPLPVGTYYWVLKGVDHLGKPIAEKGPVLIVR